MHIIVRLYARYDMDLLALLDAGYPLKKMIVDVLVAYANKIPINYLCDENIMFDSQKVSSLRLNISTPSSEDEKMKALFLGLKKNTKSQFVKMCLRNALLSQNLIAFFLTDAHADYESEFLKKSGRLLLQNVILLSSLRETGRTVQLGLGINASLPDAKVVKPVKKEPVKPEKESVKEEACDGTIDSDKLSEFISKRIDSPVKKTYKFEETTLPQKKKGDDSIETRKVDVLSNDNTRKEPDDNNEDLMSLFENL